MVRAGLIGFPNSGKTTLFNALTGLDALTAPHPYTTTETNLGVMRVRDPSLARVSALERSRKTTYATVDLHDPPVVTGSGRWRGGVGDPDVLIAVLRGHEAPQVPVGGEGSDPVAQAEDLLVEAALADFEMFDRRRERILKEATADPSMRPAAETIGRAADLLAEGVLLRAVSWSEAAMRVFRDMAPLSLVPCVWVVNVAEDDPDPAPALDGVASLAPGTDRVLAVSALIEEEVARLDPEEREEMYEGLGLGEGAARSITRAVYDALGLVTFYTLSSKESRAWTVPAGTGARRAAGKIHSDMERGFIRAEVAPVADVIRCGGWARARSARGVVRVEGRDYPIQDGEVMRVRFSV